MWTTPQRRILALAVLVVLALLSWQAARHSMYVASDPADPAPRPAQLSGRVDPNTADWATLAALPALGQAQARQIVAYRQWFAGRYPGEKPFRQAKDLANVQGIGPSTVSALEPYLDLPPAVAP